MPRVPQLLLSLQLLLGLLPLVQLLLLLLLRREHLDDTGGGLHAMSVLLVHRLLRNVNAAQNMMLVSRKPAVSCTIHLYTQCKI